MALIVDKAVCRAGEYTYIWQAVYSITCSMARQRIGRLFGGEQ